MSPSAAKEQKSTDRTTATGECFYASSFISRPVTILALLLIDHYLLFHAMM